MTGMQTNTPIIPDSLYELAFAYKKTKLWKMLWDTQLFAVQMPDGEIGYCCVMGKNGEHTALAVYVGQSGIDAYRNLGKEYDMIILDENGNDAPTFQMHEKLMSQDCIQCAFERNYDMRDVSVAEAQHYARRYGVKHAGIYPDFVRYKPSRYPWYVRDEADQRYIAEALSAAIEVNRRIEADVARYKEENPSAAARNVRKTVIGELGFTDGAPYDRRIPFIKHEADGSFTWSSMDLPMEKQISYPSPTLPANDILLSRVKKAKSYKNSLKHKGAWYCDIVMLPQATSDQTYDGLNGHNADNAAAGGRWSEDEAEEAAEPFEAPIFPMAILAVDRESQEVVDARLVLELDTEGCARMVRNLAEMIADNGKPLALIVKESDMRTRTLIQAFAEQAGIALESCHDCDTVLINAEIAMLNMMKIDEDDGEDMTDEDYQYGMDMLTKHFMSLGDDSLMKLPQHIRDALLNEAHAGRMDKELGERLIRIFEGK